MISFYLHFRQINRINKIISFFKNANVRKKSFANAREVTTAAAAMKNNNTHDKQRLVCDDFLTLFRPIDICKWICDNCCGLDFEHCTTLPICIVGFFCFLMWELSFILSWLNQSRFYTLQSHYGFASLESCRTFCWNTTSTVNYTV